MDGWDEVEGADGLGGPRAALWAGIRCPVGTRGAVAYSESGACGKELGVVGLEARRSRMDTNEFSNGWGWTG